MGQPEPVVTRPLEDTDVTGHLLAVRDGGRPELDALFSVVYQQLKAIARRRVGASVPTPLDATGLVHEAYLRLVEAARTDWRDRQHFFAAAARAMRHIIVDAIRHRRALKRGGDAGPVTLDEAHGAADNRLSDALAVDEALTKVAAVDPRLVQIVELCFFMGLTTDEAGEVLGISGRTVKREWQKARALLQILLGPVDGAASGTT